MATASQSPPRVRLPHQYEPRKYQIPFWRAMDNGAKRAVKVWHRRAGKDRTDWNFVIREAYKRAGGYYYMLPKYTQARKIIWDGIDANTGRKFIDHVPKAILKKKPNDTEMKITIETHDGKESIIQLVGSDRYNDLVGTPPAGVVMSEFSISNPAAWNFFRPILTENDGWAIFNFTPRGKNHGHDMYVTAQQLMDSGDPDWFCELLTVDDTGAISLAAIEGERRSGMTEDMIQQEFYCSFEGSIHGAYYSKLITEARREGRIKQIPIVPTIPVDTYWDLGVDDSTAIWFVQIVGNERRAVHYYENSGEGLPFYARELVKISSERGFKLGRFVGPHDIKVQSLSTGVTRVETASKLGMDFEVAPRLGLMDGIDACRNIIPTTWFDEKYCDQGIKCLENYSKEWDEINRTFKTTPKHDWASHGSDAFRTFGVMAENIDNYNKLDEMSVKKHGRTAIEVREFDAMDEGADDFDPHDY
jgi:hypothetical protein